MATITLTANPATFGDGFITVRYSATYLARSTVWVTSVDTASAELDKFISQLRSTYRDGFQASASWPQGIRKPAGWDQAWKGGILCRSVRPASDTAPTLNRWQVNYSEPGAPRDVQAFMCDAEDESHAREQCQNANPSGTIDSAVRAEA